MKKIDRRSFLRVSSCSAMGYTTLFSGLVSLKAMGAAALNNSSTLNGNYKALVCILLGGGNDSYNMLVPRGDVEHTEYAQVRSNLALAQDSLLPITAATPDGKLYGIHPAMTGLQGMFDQGKAAFVANVGSLVEPVVDANEYYSGAKELPLGLFSHSDQVAHWQTAIPQDRGAIGWGGRMADLIMSMNNNTDLSMNISLAGRNIFQNGTEVFPYSIGLEGSVGINGYEGEDPFNVLKRTAVDGIMDHHYSDLFRNAYANTVATAQDSHLLFNEALQNLTPLITTFSENNFSQGMRMIARSIAIRDELDVSRQVFFVNLGGFDNHDELLNNHNGLLTVLDAGLTEFQSAMAELGVEDCVTTFTMSDFSRTLTSNGNGTDHAWGGNAIVLGGQQVNGGDIYGTYPDLFLTNNLDLGNGVIIPTTAADEYFAELALWFGVSPNDLDAVLPNIANFYSPGSGNPIGFMQL